MSDYKKPINKNTLTVRFVHKTFEQEMELPFPPKEGDYFNDINQSLCKITKVIYVPWNQGMPDIIIHGENIEG